jgi:hypothetical protein
MKYIVLTGRSDRLGANITMYVAQMFYAHHHSYHIQYDIYTLPYRDSCFVRYLIHLIDKYNSSLGGTPTERVCFSKGDWSNQIGSVTHLIRTDYLTWFKHMYGPTDWSILNRGGYTVPFDPEKTILVHLRLDDVSSVPEYDGSVSATYYRDVMDTSKEIRHIHSQ